MWSSLNKGLESLDDLAVYTGNPIGGPMGMHDYLSPQKMIIS